MTPTRDGAWALLCRSWAIWPIPSTLALKDKGFARLVPRDQLNNGAEQIGVPLEEHVMNVVEGLKSVRAEMSL